MSEGQELLTTTSTDITISVLCEICEDMVKDPSDSDEVRYERGIVDLQAGAEIGCPFCLVAVRQILDLPLNMMNGKDFEIHDLFYEIWDKGLYFEIGYVSTEDRLVHFARLFIRFHPLVGHNLRTAELAARYEYPPRTDAEAVAELIKSWLLQCTTHHSQCESKESLYHPPRLLEIQKERFRLVAPSECRVSGWYATLSHCWGSSPNFLKLTSTNEEQLRQWNSVCRLPQTFKDAALLCHRIGMKYLWIDSLCIIQEGEESTEDWSFHVIEMRTIYQNAALNIAASCAAASTEGMYRSRNAKFVKPAVIEGNKRFSLSNKPYLLVQRDHTPNYRYSPLNKRGWVFQERLLSRRVVHFEAEQVYWECNTSMICEAHPAGLEAVIHPHLAPFKLPTQETCSTAAGRWGVFKHLVSQYSVLQLTFPDKDKLAAFAGIAEHISREFNDEYNAGIWRSQLPYALLWKRLSYAKQSAEQSTKSPHVPQQLRSDDYRSPSWSWAKVDADLGRRFGAFYFVTSGAVIKHYVTIIDAKATPADLDKPFGRLKSAYIIFRGRLLPWMTVDRKKDPKSYSNFDGKNEACIDPKELFILPICASSIYGSEHRGYGYSLHSLILHKHGTGPEDFYRRVGYASVRRNLPENQDVEKQPTTSSRSDLERVEDDVDWHDYFGGFEERRLVLV